MTPTAIIGAATAKGLDVIAICDHNSAENVPALATVAALRHAQGALPSTRSGPEPAEGSSSKGESGALTVLGGMEVTSQEEVHVLALFDSSESDDALQLMQRIVYENLPGENDEDAFGEQLVCDEGGSIIGRNGRLLIGATTLTVERVVEAIRDLGGLAVASHIDRESFGIVGRLGFVPEGLALDALELSPRAGGREQWVSVAQQSGLPLVAFSDAHRLDEVGATSTSFVMESACVDELRKALHSREGRRVVT